VANQRGRVVIADRGRRTLFYELRIPCINAYICYRGVLTNSLLDVRRNIMVLLL